MSLAIDINAVTHVLLADGWHEVHNASFNLDSYEYLWSGSMKSVHEVLDEGRDPLILHGGGNSDICATGFSFIERCDDGHTAPVLGPLTSVLAVRTLG